MNKIDQINIFTYKVLGDLLFERVPEYKLIYYSDLQNDESDIGNYMFMNEFSNTLSEKIKENNSSFVKNAFKYINEIGESNNLEVINILRIGILEILYTNGYEVRDFVDGFLSDNNKKIFKSFSKFYN